MQIGILIASLLGAVGFFIAGECFAKQADCAEGPLQECRADGWMALSRRAAFAFVIVAVVTITSFWWLKPT